MMKQVKKREALTFQLICVHRVPVPWDPHICFCSSRRCELMQGCYNPWVSSEKNSDMTKDLQVKTGQKISSMQELVDSRGTLVPGGISTESDGMEWYSTAVSHKWPSVRRKRRSLPVCPRPWLLWLMSFTEPTCNIPKYKQQHPSWFLPLVKETEWVSSLSENISLFFISSFCGGFS